MAKLSSLSKFEGTLPDVTTYQTKNRNVIKRKCRLYERLETEPKLNWFQENSLLTQVSYRFRSDESNRFKIEKSVRFWPDKCNYELKLYQFDFAKTVLNYLK